MINNFLNISNYSIIGFLGVVFSYLGTCFLLGTGMNKLPRDHGRAYAHDGSISAGAARCGLCVYSRFRDSSAAVR